MSGAAREWVEMGIDRQRSAVTSCLVAALLFVLGKSASRPAGQSVSRSVGQSVSPGKRRENKGKTEWAIHTVTECHDYRPWTPGPSAWRVSVCDCE